MSEREIRFFECEVCGDTYSVLLDTDKGVATGACPHASKLIRDEKVRNAVVG